jgi:carbon monoxide dehydrogenase subunit G
MAGFEMTEVIARPPAEVFGFITDPANAPRVSPSIQKMERISDGPTGVGTRYRETRVMNGKPAQAELQVTRFEPPTTYAVQNETEGIKTVYTYTLTPQVAGTRVQLVAELHAVGLKKAMLPIVAGILKKEDGDHLKHLKTAMEGT